MATPLLPTPDPRDRPASPTKPAAALNSPSTPTMNCPAAPDMVVLSSRVGNRKLARLTFRRPPLTKRLDRTRYPLATTDTPPILRRFHIPLSEHVRVTCEESDGWIHDGTAMATDDTAPASPVRKRQASPPEALQALSNHGSGTKATRAIDGASSPLNTPYALNHPPHKRPKPRAVPTLESIPCEAAVTGLDRAPSSSSSSSSTTSSSAARLTVTTHPEVPASLADPAAPSHPYDSDCDMSIPPGPELAKTPSTNPPALELRDPTDEVRSSCTLPSPCQSPRVSAEFQSRTLPSPASVAPLTTDSYFDALSGVDSIDPLPLDSNQTPLAAPMWSQWPADAPQLAAIPDIMQAFDTYSSTVQSYVLFHLLQRCASPTLQFVNSIIQPALHRDFIADLPSELSSHVLKFLDAPSLGRAAQVSRKWKTVVDTCQEAWAHRLMADQLTNATDQARDYMASSYFQTDALPEPRSDSDPVPVTSERHYRDHLHRLFFAPAATRSRLADATPTAQSIESSALFASLARLMAGTTRSPSLVSASALTPSALTLLPGPAVSASAPGAGAATSADLAAPRYMTRARSAQSNEVKLQSATVRPSAAFLQTLLAHCHVNDHRYLLPLLIATPDMKSDVHQLLVRINARYLASQLPSGFPRPNLCKLIYSRQYEIERNWQQCRYRRRQFEAKDDSIITCLQFDEKRVVSGSDGEHIYVYDTQTGELISQLDGHSGGVWTLQYIGNTLVSGSTDRSVRVWDIERQECTHVFVGHTSTVRCLQILMPTIVGYDGQGQPLLEPRLPLIVTGSRDSTLRVWKLPVAGRDPPYRPTNDRGTAVTNPYLVHVLPGHSSSVRALVGKGNLVVSGSYDMTVRVWNVEEGECKWRLTGHAQRVYSVALADDRKRCMSGSLDGSVRVWNLEDGTCTYVLDGHQNLVGLLQLTPNYLVSAGADATLRIWSNGTFYPLHVLSAHIGTITCFHNDERRLASGSENGLKLWDMRTGRLICDLLNDVTGIWQVKFDDRRCVAAVQRGPSTFFEVFDFGESQTQLLQPAGSPFTHGGGTLDEVTA
ncbi:SCF ubiquitin ligase complex subunit cdc4 [Dimargaris verticillata]|uniref:SCF ubiquitin ligase complex subunit cdc4 n=1 Tax=Dimargaris verticillata TaxID=2761393 RepID=A0A9W8B4L2_9FUNG|nr:SCF ubiquitin ligase complex subunit cdc4 [Dimargaris verticillata]